MEPILRRLFGNRSKPYSETMKITAQQKHAVGKLFLYCKCRVIIVGCENRFFVFVESIVRKRDGVSSNDRHDTLEHSFHYSI